jgi:methylated-DNA-[protein]-cysteine S-methyltransferase
MESSKMQTVVWREMESPIGILTLAATSNGLCYLSFGKDEDALRLKTFLDKAFHSYQLEKNGQALLLYVNQLQEYFSKKRTQFDLPLDLYGTPFQKKVWSQLRNIPFGEIRTYKEIAQAIGRSKAVRAVGGANNRNPIPIIIPCHRIIGSNGSLVGYAGGIEIKEYLLTLEANQSVDKGLGRVKTI